MIREYFPGLGQAVADRTINRKIPDLSSFVFPDLSVINENDPHRQAYEAAALAKDSVIAIDHTNSGPLWPTPPTRSETWGEVAARVSLGNALLTDGSDRDRMQHHLEQASLLMSGRHLQHGDESQPSRNQEVFTNCSTSASTFLLFYLLLNGSGVGRAYDDALILADFNFMPIVVPVIDGNHPDRLPFPSRRDAEHMYAGRKITVFETPDSREGWAKAIELIERMTFEKRRDEVLILDFSLVRPRGAPIRGMQNRPSSGPGPLMEAIRKMAALRDAKMDPWRAAMFADHYAAECVLVGGARRAARMATKHWADLTIFGFIELKRGGFLFSSNNSVTIDDDFRSRTKGMIEAMRLEGKAPTDEAYAQKMFDHGWVDGLTYHAYKVLMALAKAAYFDQTGEPGIINQDRLTAKGDITEYEDGRYAESERFQVDDETRPLMVALAKATIGLRYSMITNPCGEICLLLLGAYCVIADVVPFFAIDDFDAEDAFRTAVRALMRTNLMDCLYRREVNRTNRIGVGMTGFHEWAYARFGYTWHDIIDENKSKNLWDLVARFKAAIQDEAEKYAKELGVTVPHTTTTFKPAGTTSKLFGLTEGAHLPAMREYIRWVQFRHDDPLVDDYASRGYPVRRNLKTYEGTSIVGFPTRPPICQLDGGDWIVTAAEATPEEQYQFLRLLEKYWVDNQVSYTLKYDPKKVSFDQFLETLIDGQFSIKCCSVMPQIDTSAYEYQPEQPVSREEFDAIVANINDPDLHEDVDFAHVDCGSGACPIDFKK